MVKVAASIAVDRPTFEHDTRRETEPAAHLGHAAPHGVVQIKGKGTITPAKPNPGSIRHAFGRCDIATLQELYDVPSKKTRISVCNDVATRLTLTSSASTVTLGQKVRFKAQLNIADSKSYGRLRSPERARSTSSGRSSERGVG